MLLNIIAFERLLKCTLLNPGTCAVSVLGNSHATSLMLVQFCGVILSVVLSSASFPHFFFLRQLKTYFQATYTFQFNSLTPAMLMPGSIYNYYKSYLLVVYRGNAEVYIRTSSEFMSTRYEILLR